MSCQRSDLRKTLKYSQSRHFRGYSTNTLNINIQTPSLPAPKQPSFVLPVTIFYSFVMQIAVYFVDLVKMPPINIITYDSDITK